MKVAIFVVTVAGIAIGLSLPSAKRQAIAAPGTRAEGKTTRDLPRETVLQRENNGHFFTVADVNGEPIKFVVDTGATEVALTMNDARRIGLTFDPASFQVVGVGAGGGLRGAVVELNDVVLDGKRVSGIHALVIDGLTISLLGQNFLRKLNTVSISGDTMTLR